MSQEPKLSIERTGEGYIIRYGFFKAGPFKSLKEADPLKVSAELNGLSLSFQELLNLKDEDMEKWEVKPKDIIKLKLSFSEEEQPLSVEELKQILGTTIKRDDTNKIITFLCMLSAYTEESQFNVSFRAPSSTGKSYIPLELDQYFPPEDVIELSYSSPTAFFHDQGVWDEDEKAIKMDLERKILIFIDQPHDQLLQRLRPLLSHDRKNLLVKITDKSEKKGLRTKNVIIKGFPSCIFCTGSLRIDEQEQTRHIILSPETSQEKLREAIYLKAMRKANPVAFQEYLREHPEREVLKRRIRAIKEANVKNVIIRNYDAIVERFRQKYPKLKPRHSRDVERLISIIQGLALLNLWHREKDEENNIYANDEDIENGFKLYDEIAEAQELGIPPFLYNLFKEIIKPLYHELNKGKKEGDIFLGLSRQEILKKYYEVHGRLLNQTQFIKEILPALENSGLIYQEPDPNDKRRMLIYCTTPPSNPIYPDKSMEKYMGSHGGGGSNSGNEAKIEEW